MKLYATIENEKGKKVGVGSNNKLQFELKLGNLKFAEGTFEDTQDGYALYFSTTLENEEEDNQCIDFFIPKKLIGGQGNIKCECGKRFYGLEGKEDTCPQCLEKIMKGNKQKGNKDDMSIDEALALGGL